VHEGLDTNWAVPENFVLACKGKTFHEWPVVKFYAQLTQSYLLQCGLTRVQVRDAATGRPILMQVTPERLKQLERQGRIILPFTSPNP
jgi:hypothetical protein